MSNSKYLMETPNFEWCLNLVRLDLSGCTKLSEVHPSIGLLKRLAYLNLQNCSSLVSLNLGTECRLSSLRVLRLSGCTKLVHMPNLTGLSNLEYLDSDQCTSLLTIHESIGSLSKVKFFSLRDCTNLIMMPVRLSTMTSLQTLDMGGCFNFENLPRGLVQNPWDHSLISLDLSFCKISRVPKALENLRCLERLNLQGSKIRHLYTDFLPSLAYLNLAHCCELSVLPWRRPIVTASSTGRYFKTVSASRNHRSGLYIFDCPIVEKRCSMLVALSWLARLIKVRTLLSFLLSLLCLFSFTNISMCFFFW